MFAISDVEVLSTIGHIKHVCYINGGCVKCFSLGGATYFFVLHAQINELVCLQESWSLR